MSNEREPIGFLPCKKCLQVKRIYQGNGKRAKFLYARCGCGLNQLTGDTVQAEFQKHMSKEDAAEALNKLKEPKPNGEEPPKPKASKAPWIVGGVLAVVGLLSLRG
ncbi:hypothetical protein L1D14_18105 [Vibrio tubiashii]|uniref:hypothetical protein n=1 Tax=Vibrio tubiashii TaxID=29498 RepID=UPI001EFD950E|nr:hypothetical protein [Vibrio tubiashii]MCG9578131.1 hypothetical protein [Vibrio tubiashii]